MQVYLLLAGLLVILVGLIHSILGEVLIFNRMRDKQIIPTSAHPVLRERHVRILWATWHAVTVLGWGIAAVLLIYAFPHTGGDSKRLALQAIGISMLAASVLVFFATRGMHPGWFGLLAVAALIWLG